MLQSRGDLYLAHEAIGRDRVAEVRVEQLHRYRSPVFHIERAVHLRHSAAADEPFNDVARVVDRLEAVDLVRHERTRMSWGLPSGSIGPSSYGDYTRSPVEHALVYGVCLVMLKRIKAYWTELKHGRPGSRFREQYERSRREQKNGFGRALRIIGGAALIPVGLFFLAVPGPGLPIIALGLVLIAREFRFAARLLDSLELRLRPAWKWVQERWKRLVRARRAVTR